uniref:Uncharacterized protein n=1 Tax=Hanusia phi TaxID=3032 RepID=A0A7S0EXL7_9CRYP
MDLPCQAHAGIVRQTSQCVMRVLDILALRFGRTDLPESYVQRDFIAQEAQILLFLALQQGITALKCLLHPTPQCALQDITAMGSQEFLSSAILIEHLSTGASLRAIATVGRDTMVHKVLVWMEVLASR